MMKDEHIKYMNRCLELARNGQGRVAPNPMVGSVIVYNGHVIGEGYHQKHGGNHAEVNAINSVKDKSLLPHSTLYVNLEPCAHYGKTPPCSVAIIEYNIPKVVIGAIDNNLLVAGKGIEKMQAEGIEVIQGILEQECRALNKRFYCCHEKRRPYIILKWAQTKDGFLDKERLPAETGINWITGEIERKLVHKWRSEEQAIFTGTNTIKIDNPSLTTRYWPGKSPVRIILDRNRELSANYSVFSNKAETLVFNQVVSNKEGHIEYIKVKFDESLLNSIMVHLHEKGIQSIIVEGGVILLNSFIRQNMWDEARVFVGEKKFHKGLAAPVIDADVHEYYNFGTSQLFIYK